MNRLTIFLSVLISVNRGKAEMTVDVTRHETKVSSENLSNFFLLRVFPNLKSASSNTSPTAGSNEESRQLTPEYSQWTACSLAGVQSRRRVCQANETEERKCLIDWTSQMQQCSELADAFGGINQRLRILEGQIQNLTGHVKGNVQPLTNSETSCETGFTKDGWYRASNGYEYKYVNTTLNFVQAAINCKRLDSSSRLATVGGRSGILGSGIGALGRRIPDGGNYFVGATDAVKEDTWIFHDGVVMNTTSIKNWGNTGPQEPNMGRREQCLMWCHAGGRTNVVGFGDAPCRMALPSMCERKAQACKSA